MTNKREISVSKELCKDAMKEYMKNVSVSLSMLYGNITGHDMVKVNSINYKTLNFRRVNWAEGK